MLIVISDLHLTDGTTAANPHRTAIELLMRELEASIGAKGPTELRFLLLGDIYDLVRTDYWHSRLVPAIERPWGGKTLDPATGMNPFPGVETQFQDVLGRILPQPSSQALIDGIKALAEKSGLPTTVHYVRGNHDRVLNNFPSLERLIADAFAPVKVEFSNEFHGPEYALFARHGHQWDEHCHGWKFLTKVLDPRSKAKQFSPEAHRVMGIGEVVTAELMSGFVHYVTEQVGVADPFRALAAEVNNLRPMSDVVSWLTWMLDRSERFKDRYLPLAKESFGKALEDTLNCTLAREWDRVKRDLVLSGDLTDMLTKARWTMKRKKGLEWLQALIPVKEDVDSALTLLRGRREDGCSKGAASELSGKEIPAGVQYLLYGHTHGARQACVTAKRDGTVRMYVNTGTFLPLIERAADRGSFFRSNRMTFNLFYHKGEDVAHRRGDGPTMDVWDGMKRKDYL